MVTQVYRLKAGSVKSFSKLAYGVENTTMLHAVPAVEHGKKRYYMSDKGVGTYPILISGDYPEEMLMDLYNQGSKTVFEIKGSKPGFMDYSDPLEGSTIWIKWRNINKTKKAIEVHDGGMMAAKNIINTVAGASTKINDAISHAASDKVISAVATTPSKIFKAINIVKKIKKKQKNDIGIMISYFPLNNGYDTGKKKITANELRYIASQLMDGTI